MHQVWRFIKWTFTEMTFRSWTLVVFSFCFGAGITANDEFRSYLWGTCMVIGAYWWLGLVVDAVKYQWNKFRAEDEKVFDILKQEKIEG